MEADLIKENDRKRSLHENHGFSTNSDSFSIANIEMQGSFVELNESQASFVGTFETGKDAAQIFQKQGPTLSDEGNSEEKIDSFDANETSDVSLAIVKPPVSQSRKKLLVLDLNGLLADIVYNPPIDYTPDALVAGRAIFKRPYCDEFLKFCCERFEVGIWSSRNRKNVERFIDFLMGDMKQKLLFCWDSSYCTTTQFNTLGHKYKPLVFKDLRKLWEKHDPDLPWEKGYYNESNTLLIDDSPYKALLNPPHTAIFPHSFKFDMKDNSLGDGGDLKVYLERLASADNVQNFVEQNPLGQIAITERSQDWGFYSQVIDTCLQSELQNDVGLPT
ncbi:ubiquitin-like domain-containing CTD phosphatase 1 [Gossypium hirsutum]|uniref:Mitochondrial import inner membrane translocase subunit TIM50 n=1 Tax=Gossypium hirsutum TaxID=3635 RepID=A0A1U8HXQ7_GOSHI|nr:ubiquitin-like domain-containing CTD phosphatase 1 [Gossypium hirsutum]